MLATLYLKVKVYITSNLLNVYNLQKILWFKWNYFFRFLYFQVFSSPWKLNKSFLRFCFLGDLLKLYFFTRCLYFHHYWSWDRGKIQFFYYFWRTLPKFEEKIFEVHKQSWLKITWIHKKLDSMQNLVEDIRNFTGLFWAKPVHSVTQTLVLLPCLEQILCFILIITSPLFRFWVIESQLYLLSITSNFFSFSWLGLQILFWKLHSWIETSNIKQLVELLYSWAKSRHVFVPLK